MASNAPSDCCLKLSFHEGTPKGSHKQIFGLDTYQVGEQHGNDRVIVILTDIYGHKLQNVLLIADELSKSGYQVLIPDILKGEPVDGSIPLPEWLKKHPSEVTQPIVSAFLDQLTKEYNPKFVGGIGYCYGAKYVIQELSKSGRFTAGAVAHPSFVDIEEVRVITNPILISAAETDGIFPPELRHETEKVLAEIGARYQLDLFSGVEHGFAVKGDVKDPLVKYAREKVLSDQLVWFSQF